MNLNVFDFSYTGDHYDRVTGRTTNEMEGDRRVETGVRVGLKKILRGTEHELYDINAYSVRANE